eukprot:9193269-Pyramimonas_sp.AAC.1
MNKNTSGRARVTVSVSVLPPLHSQGSQRARRLQGSGLFGRLFVSMLMDPAVAVCFRLEPVCLLMHLALGPQVGPSLSRE